MPRSTLLVFQVFCLVLMGMDAMGKEAEKLVPARFGRQTDNMGANWDVGQMGEIVDGTNDCFDNAAVMQIDGNQVQMSGRPMMSVDGKEFVIEGRHQGISVTRRVRLDPEKAVMRYLEKFNNPGKGKVTLQVKIQTNLGGSAVRVVDINEAVTQGQLGKGEGVFVTIGQGRPSVVFWVSDAKSKIKPAVRINSNRTIDVNYTLEVPAGGEVAVVHYLAQRVNGTGASGRDLIAALSKHGRLLDAGIPKEARKSIVNFNFGQGEEDEKVDRVLGPLQELADSADVPRGNLDSVLIDIGAKLSGTVTGSDFEIETVFGKTGVEFEQVAGVAGGAGVHRPIRVFMRNGEILNGTVSGAKVTMKTESGLNLDLNFEELHLLVLKKQEAVSLEKGMVLVTTQRGDRLVLSKEGAAPLEAATPWGMVQVQLSELRSLVYLREPFPSHRLVLADRSQLLVMLRGGEWVAPTVRFGALKMLPQAIREMQSLLPSQAEAGPTLELVGENRMAGSIDLAELHLATEASLTAVTTGQILKLELEAQDNGEHMALIKLAGGQELKGRLTESVLPIRANERVWRVPVAHLLNFTAPEPKAQSDTPISIP